MEKLLETGSRWAKVDPEGFNEYNDLEDIDWDEIGNYLNKSKNKILEFITIYKDAYSMNPEELKKRVTIDKDLWQKIKKEIITGPYPQQAKCSFASMAQSIKPEGFEDIILPINNWERTKINIAALLEEGNMREAIPLAAEMTNLNVE